MSATALPPIPTPEKSSAGSAKQPSAAPDKVGDSNFDNVSRQEQQRLERNRETQSRQKAEKAEPQTPDKTGTPADTKVAAPAGKQADGTRSGKAASAEATDEAPAVSGAEIMVEAPMEPELVFTFAQLQNLVMPEQAMAPATPASAGLASGASGMSALAPGMSPTALAGTGTAPGVRAMIPGMSGSTGKMGQETTGRILAESVMAQLDGEGSKPVDTGLMANLGRLQGALEVPGQAQLANPGQKIPEAMMPLRGYATSVELPVGHAEWGDKLVGKLAWLTSQKMTMAEIHLTPPDMGPLEVRVQVQNDQANVTIHAANPAVRDQLELHSHRLRDMLNGQGLELQNFDVADSPGRGGAEADDQEGQAAGGGQTLNQDADDLELADAAGSLDLTWRNEVDLYA